MDLNDFVQRTAQVHARVDDMLNQSDQSPDQQQLVLGHALTELQSAMEELRVAEEELHQQNDELRSMQELLEQERWKYQELFEFAPDGHVVTDLDGAIQDANHAFGAMMNITLRFTHRKPLATFVHPEDRRRFRLALKDLARSVRVEDLEVRLQPRRCPHLVGSLKATPVVGENGKVAALLWSIRDVTRHRQAEDEIRRLNAELETRVEERTAQLTAANQTKDELLQHEKAARAAAEIARQRLTFLARAGNVLATSLDFELTLASLARLAVPDLADWTQIYLVNGDRVERVAMAQGNLETGAFFHDWFKGQPLDPTAERPVLDTVRAGTARILTSKEVEFLASCIRDDEATSLRSSVPHAGMVASLVARGQVVGAIAMLAVGSGRYFGSDDLLVAEELAARAALAIDNARLYRESQQAITARNHLLTVVSHDLKNPLSIIKGYVQILKRRVARASVVEELTDGLDNIDRMTTKIAGLLDELLDVARLEMRQKFDLTLRQADLVALVGHIAAEHAHTTEHHRISFEATTCELRGIWDVTRLEQVVSNLLSNAIKYSPNGGDIMVTVEMQADESGEWATLTVRDQGLGIPASDLPHIFQGFRRASNVGQIEGTGVGLASARNIVELHGGTIRIDSIENEGTTVIVRLPLQPEEAGSASRS